MLSGEITIRVRYAETDRMGLMHHANYLVYFEQGRTELLRSLGLSYKDLEDRGYFLVIARVEIKYKSPAHYDDLLEPWLKVEYAPLLFSREAIEQATVETIHLHPPT